MKNLLENKVFAIGCMLVLMISASFYGANRSLKQLYNQTNDVFYNGVDGDGIGIHSDLNTRINESQNLLTIARKYDSVDEVLIKAVENSIADLSNEKSISKQYTINNQLSEDTTNLIEALNDSNSLTEKDISYVQGIKTTLSTRNDTIFRDSYNQYVSDYNNELNQFPASILGKVTGVKQAEYFR